MSRSPIRVLPLTPAPFAIFLSPADEPAGGDPFVRLDRIEDGASRAYLAELRSAAGVVCQRLVLKLPATGLERSGTGDERPASLISVDLEWARRAADLRRLGEASHHFPRLLLPAESSPPPTELPPMVYCPGRGRLFAIHCPQTLEALVTCRDDALLAAAGLPAYSTTRTALLFNPGLERASESPLRFWVTAEQPPPELAEKGVGGLAQLRQELAETLAAKAEGPEAVSPADYPDPSAGKRTAWRVFTDRDSPYLLTPYAAYDFDRFVDHLGGRSATAKAEGADQTSDPATAAGPGYLFAAEGSGLDAVEVLLLKLVLFSQVLQALRSYYQTIRLPHLDLHPGHLVVSPLTRGDDLPHRWSFQLELLGLSAARSRTMPQGVEVNLPPDPPRIPYCSPRVQTASLLKTGTGEAIIDRVQKLKADDGPRWEIHARLRDPNGILPRPTRRDWLRIEWPQSLLGGSLRATMARCDPEVGGNPAELLIVTAPLVLDPSEGQSLEKARNLKLPGVRYRVHPELHVPDDVYSLGVLLLRSILVNDRQDLSAVAKPIAAIRPVIGPEATDGEASIDESLAAALAEQPEAFASSNVFYRSSDRASNRPSSIPEELWQELLHFAWRLIARGPGFGLPPDGGFDEHHPASHLEQVQSELDGYLRRLRLILFRRQPVHFEVHSVIDEILAGLPEAPG
jgi:hypothetical protein